MSELLPPGSVIGILGGGQLGKMLALAAARLGFRARLYAPPGENPAAWVVERTVIGSPDWRDGLHAFARDCAVLTYETENIPADALRQAARFAPVRPGPRPIEVAQDRLIEKTFLRDLGVDTAPFAQVDDAAGLAAARAELGGRAILKTRRFGYDGKGQLRLAAPDGAAGAEADAIAAIAGAPAILEGEVPFLRELSVIAARALDGEVVCYDPAENTHCDGVLSESRTPGAISPDVAGQAVAIARRILEGLDYVGVLGVELFELANGRLIVNEIAPRVHNSGHWTLEACAVSQFEQHVRAICGWPLGDPARHSDAVCVNLLGEDAAGWRAIAEEPGAALHLYGKALRAGRKMGHVTRLSPRRR